MKDRLKPTFKTLGQEYVLVQAWKKAHDHIRYHNWYADVLALDYANAGLQKTLSDLSATIREGAGDLSSEPLRLVLAPKANRFVYGRKKHSRVKADRWHVPDKSKTNGTSLRPLAHATVRDQTIATAFMMCLADRIETLQGDPTAGMEKCRKTGMVSYGNRLLCDPVKGGLRPRWGNSTVYRKYYQDYQAFVKRPEAVVAADFPDDTGWAIVHCDLSQFYDRVTSAELCQKLVAHAGPSTDEKFIEAFRSFFRWDWHHDDLKLVRSYVRDCVPPLRKFDREIALPQGLVASGFFANLFLLDFDQAVFKGKSQAQNADWEVVDYCRYVDDLRIVIRHSIPGSGREVRDRIRSEVSNWTSEVLREEAPGLRLNPSKTKVILGDQEAARMVVYSPTMKTIQNATSGTMDVATGHETLQLVEGLFTTRISPPRMDADAVVDDPLFSAIPDVGEETVARFAANRFRKTFRSLRVLCGDDEALDESWEDEQALERLSRKTLDKRGQFFARQLLWRWVSDPSNVRLMRVGLDIYPDHEMVERICQLLKGELASTESDVKWTAQYCMAELFKAISTETGFVSDPDFLPNEAELDQVRQEVTDLAWWLLENKRPSWYLRQQALLLLACRGKFTSQLRSVEELSDYTEIHSFLSADFENVDNSRIVATTLVGMGIGRGGRNALHNFAVWLKINSDYASDACRELLLEDRTIGERFWKEFGDELEAGTRAIFEVSGLRHKSPPIVEGKIEGQGYCTVEGLAEVPRNPFHQEIMAVAFLERLLLARGDQPAGLITPRGIIIAPDGQWSDLYPESSAFLDFPFSVKVGANAEDDPLFAIPDWIDSRQAFRYEAGQLLRSLLTGNTDFSLQHDHRRRDENPDKYDPLRSHWYRRRFGHFNGRSALGPEWRPISSWLSSLLARLLAWPGYTESNDETGLPSGFSREALVKSIRERLATLSELFGSSSRLPLLHTKVRHTALTKSSDRGRVSDAPPPLRVGVVQAILPRSEDLISDPTVEVSGLRSRQRRHFSAIVRAVDRMLEVRSSHAPFGDRLDLLLLPELCIHLDDVSPILEPFVRQHRCIVFGGTIYHRNSDLPDSPLVNYGLWMVPTESATSGLSIERIWQGKGNLAHEESIPDLVPHRDAQHILDIQRASTGETRWRLTGSICYDATDIALASDLKGQSDVWIIPALNRSVDLFDTMAKALNYHTYQHIIICNNGQFGGSCAHAPSNDTHQRVILHHHGNEQAAISFFELPASGAIARAGFRTHPAPRSGALVLPDAVSTPVSDRVLEEEPQDHTI